MSSTLHKSTMFSLVERHDCQLDEKVTALNKALIILNIFGGMCGLIHVALFGTWSVARL